jgi:hypothetical protein
VNDQDQLESSQESPALPEPVDTALAPETLPGGNPVDEQQDTELSVAPIEFSWQASEYVQHHKSMAWYVVVVAAVIVLSVGAGLLHFWFSIGVFIAMGAAVIVYASRPPRTLTYDLSGDGLHIDGKLFPFHTFRSFSVLRDVSWHTIDLEPTQRFMPRLSVLFNDNDLESIASHLMAYLPRVDRELDMIERLTRYLRF